jgi:hypothetical protein
VDVCGGVVERMTEKRVVVVVEVGVCVSSIHPTIVMGTEDMEAETMAATMKATETATATARTRPQTQP